MATDDAGRATCDICDGAGEGEYEVKAEAYCPECLQFLCSSCCRCHRRIRASRHHRLTTNKDAPTDEIRSPKSYCKVHVDKVLQVVCQSHDQSLCDLCLLVDGHKNCKLTNLAQTSNGTPPDLTCREMIEKVASLVKEVDELVTDRDSEIGTLTETARTAVYALNRYAATCKNFFDNAVNEVEEKRDDLINVTRHQVAECKRFRSYLQTAEEQLERAVRENDEDNFFLYLPTGGLEALKKFEFMFEQLQKDSTHTKINFNINQSLADALENNKRFGKIEVSSQPLKPRRKISEQDADDAEEFIVRVPTDRKSCTISGMLQFEDGAFLLADYSNHKLKLFDVDFNFLAEMAVSSGPWDVACINEEVAWYTMPDARKFGTVRVKRGHFSNSLRDNGHDQRLTAVQGTICYGIDVIYWQNESDEGSSKCDLFYTSETYNQVNVYKAGCRYNDYIARDDKWNYIFKCPHHLYVAMDDDDDDEEEEAETNDGYTIYATDRSNNCMFALSKEGKILYKLKELDCPTGVTVDSKGNIYIAEYGGGQVLMTDAGGDNLKVLTTAGLLFPESVLWCQKRDRLIVGLTSSDVVKVLKTW